MTEGGQTVCLCMIVRNEAHVIERCLESVRPFIDYAVICDTGSEDDTLREIRDSRALRVADIDPRLFIHKWQDFATNRNMSLELAEPHADFALIIDADDWLTAPPDYQLPDLTQDAYWLPVEHGSISYSRPQLVRLGRGCRWRGVLHEFLEVPGGLSRGELPLTVHYGGDGARSRDPEKFRKDAELLERALKEGQDSDLHPRYTFYLAQSYRDAGQAYDARDWYHRRTNMGGWSEEVYVSWLRRGQIAESIGRGERAVGDYALAQAVNPLRLEALVAEARWYRLHGQYADAYALLNDWRNRHGGPLQPPGALFAEPWVYRYGFWDELALSAYYTGEYRISLDAALQALKGDPPPADRKRIIDNAEWALRKL